jgi:ribosomal protein S18 acetylase RimI-like enzyme
VGLGQLDLFDRAGPRMGLMMIDAAPAPVSGYEPNFAHVISTLRAACNRRTTPANRLDRPGMFGVLSGAAPIVWAHGAVGGRRLRAVLAASPDVREIYVTASRMDVVAGVLEDDWHVHAHAGHYFFAGQPERSVGVPASYSISEAGPSDVPDIRAMMVRSFGVPAEVIADGYPDDFFIKAAPSRLFIARDAAGNVVGSVGARSQGSPVMLFGQTVDPRHRRRGVARALAQTAMLATAEDAAFLHAVTNDITGALASSLGAREVGRWLHLLRGPAAAS